MGHVAVGIARLLAFGRAARVEGALLTENEEGALGVAAAVHVALRDADLLERCADVDSRGLEARGVAPGDRAVERPIELEDTGAVAVATEPLPIAGGQRVARDASELLG